MTPQKVDICFIVAMRAEANGIIKELSLKEDETFASSYPARAWKGKFNKKCIAVVINGQDNRHKLDLIGTQAATLSTHLAITHYNPGLVISAGTAGAFKEMGANIGDVFLSWPYVVYHDRRVEIPGWDEMGIGRYPVFDVREMAQQLGLKTAIVTSGNSLDMPETDEKTIRKLNAGIKEMEAAAVAWVCSLNRTPVFCIKSVTDLVDVDHPTHQQFQTNLKMAVTNLCAETLKVLAFLTDKQ
ncbi:phosphorylase family protein [Natronoflexus pectinivorans]|uniref:Adenosylhomocysteine nucleosidase/5'-methylthioadenosine nucleosidase n=1 Tax=Natronoflexus pectinivorans TaxID=682526 RepID=A0A4V2RWA4_9BACT|nr:5'-methylthioadenosine nucleosidase [Natronoflexus pectinivorans]TCO07495.1 adenosylhomocysteine nucleosidase/5'-methylthioadenosine nucleosidase [Natronoflexus pectinivorans]